MITKLLNVAIGGVLLMVVGCMGPEASSMGAEDDSTNVMGYQAVVADDVAVEDDGKIDGYGYPGGYPGYGYPGGYPGYGYPGGYPGYGYPGGYPGYGYPGFPGYGHAHPMPYYPYHYHHTHPFPLYDSMEDSDAR